MVGASSSAEELVVATNRTRLMSIAAGAAALVVAGGWLLSIAGRMGPIEGRCVEAIGLVGIVFFGAGLIYASIRLVRPTPAVVVSRQGLLDRASAVSVGFIAWTEIKELREYRFMNQVLLGIVPRDLDALLARQPAWKRVFLRANLWLGVAPVNVPESMLSMRVSQLVQEIDARFRRPSVAPRGVGHVD